MLVILQKNIQEVDLYFDSLLGKIPEQVRGCTNKVRSKHNFFDICNGTKIINHDDLVISLRNHAAEKPICIVGTLIAELHQEYIPVIEEFAYEETSGVVLAVIEKGWDISKNLKRMALFFNEKLTIEEQVNLLSTYVLYAQQINKHMKQDKASGAALMGTLHQYTSYASAQQCLEAFFPGDKK